MKRPIAFDKEVIMNARNFNQRTANNRTNDRASRTITLVWGQGHERTIQARWLTDINNSQGALREKRYNVIAS